MKEGLPKGWIQTTLGEVCSKPQYGWTCPAQPEGSVHLLRTTDLSSGVIDWTSVPFCSEVPDDLAKFRVEIDDVLVSRAGSVGVSHRIRQAPREAVFASYLIRFRAKPGVLPAYVERFLQSDAYWKAISDCSSGIAIPNVNASKLAEIALPLPPTSEQRRIVAKLEALLAKVDTSRKRLERIPTILKRFRQAVLAAAVEGRLTEEWRQANPQEERTETTLGEVAIEFRTGPFGSSLHQSDYVRDGIPVINPTNILNGSLVPNEDVTVSEETFGRLSDYALKVGDIIIARRGEMGRCAVVGEKECGWLCGTGSALVRLKRVAIPAFIQAFISAPPTRQFLIEGAVGTTMANLNQGIFKSVPISLPSGPEQVEILRRLSELDALADQIEARYLKAKTHVDRLTQSILAKAFRGELVPQDPKDEPAEMLLARLKAQPADAATSKRRGRPKKAGG